MLLGISFSASSGVTVYLINTCFSKTSGKTHSEYLLLENSLTELSQASHFQPIGVKYTFGLPSFSVQMLSFATSSVPSDTKPTVQPREQQFRYCQQNNWPNKAEGEEETRFTKAVKDGRTGSSLYFICNNSKKYFSTFPGYNITLLYTAVSKYIHTNSVPLLLVFFKQVNGFIIFVCHKS